MQTRLILHEKGNHSSTMNFRVKNKQTNQTKTETILPLLSTAFLYGSNHSGKVASPEIDLQTFILEKPDEQPI